MKEQEIELRFNGETTNGSTTGESSSDDMYGLTIHKYSYEKVKYSNKKPLVNQCLEFLGETVALIDEEIAMTRTSGYVKTLQVTMGELESELEKLQQASFSFQKTAPYDETDIVSYDFKGRGVLLTLMHVLNSINSLFTKRQASRRGFNLTNMLFSSEKQLQKMIRKVNVMKVLVEMCCLLADNRNKRREIDPAVMKRGYDFPFCDDIDIDDYSQVTNMNTKDFYDDVGTQFVPWLRFGFKMIVKLTAAHGKSLKLSDVDFLQKVGLGVHHMYYMINHEHAADACAEFFKEVTPRKGQKLWDLQDHGLLSPFVYLSYSHVHGSRPFSIKMKIPTIPPSALTAIQDVTAEIGTDQLLLNINDSSSSSGEIPLTDLPHEANITVDAFNQHTASLPKLLRDMGYDHEDVHVRIILPSEQHDTIALNATEHYPILSKVLKLKHSTTACCIAPQISKWDELKNEGVVMLHIHGGGFISMSSFSHESYLRLWATALQIPIISVDYRKAPSYTYPVQVEECYRVYKWLIANAHKEILKCPLRKIIVAGDSAGGNLSLNVTVRAIHDGMRIPDALALSYPATYLSECPSTARLLGLVDPLVAMNFLKMCAGSLSHKGKDIPTGRKQGYFPFMSPAIAPVEVFKKFPPVYINTGTLDPLFDDTVYISQVMAANNGGRVKLDVYDGLAHGYMNMTDLVPEAKQATDRLIQWVVDFLEQS